MGPDSIDVLAGPGRTQRGAMGEPLPRQSPALHKLFVYLGTVFIVPSFLPCPPLPSPRPGLSFSSCYPIFEFDPLRNDPRSKTKTAASEPKTWTGQINDAVTASQCPFHSKPYQQSRGGRLNWTIRSAEGRDFWRWRAFFAFRGSS